MDNRQVESLPLLSMTFLVLGRWMLREAWRSGWIWAMTFAALLLGPLCQLASPLGITTEALSLGSYLDSIWFLSTYLGAIATLCLLARAGTPWEELSATSQASLGMGLALFSCVLFGSLAFAPLAVLGSTPGVGLRPLLCAAHWAVLASFAQRTPLTLAGKVIFLTALGWWVPALAGDTEVGERARWALGPQRHLEVGAPGVETSRGLLVDTIPLIAWWVAAALLPTRRAFRR